MTQKLNTPEMDALTAELKQVLIRHNVSLDVGVTALGHLAATLMNQQLPVQSKIEIVEQFTLALRQGITVH